jgi:Uma2 family endonuclease
MAEEPLANKIVNRKSSGVKMSAAVKTSVSVEAYLAFERAQEAKHEFHDGEIFLMAGASKAHNLVAGNVFASLHRQLRGKPCSPFIGDIKIAVPSANRFFYPDVAIICGDAAFADEDIASDATVIVEVLSDTTEAFDRGTKFQFYQQLPSLTDYILISQHGLSVERYEKLSGSEWRYTLLDTKEKTLSLRSVGVSLSLAEIYDGVTFKSITKPTRED